MIIVWNVIIKRPSLQFQAPISFNKYEAKFKSVQTYFNNYLVNDTPIRCDLCLKTSLLESRRFKTEPEIIIIVLDIITTLKGSFRKISPSFEYSLQIINCHTSSTYSLLGTINNKKFFLMDQKENLIRFLPYQIYLNQLTMRMQYY